MKTFFKWMGIALGVLVLLAVIGHLLEGQNATPNINRRPIKMHYAHIKNEVMITNDEGVPLEDCMIEVTSLGNQYYKLHQSFYTGEVKVVDARDLHDSSQEYFDGRHVLKGFVIACDNPAVIGAVKFDE